MAGKASSNDDEIASIQELMHDLEKRVRSLNAKAKTEAYGASEDIRDFVTLVTNRLSGLVRETTQNATRTVTEQAAQAGNEAVDKIRSELEHHPFTTLALAAAAGYVFGILSRR